MMHPGVRVQKIIGCRVETLLLEAWLRQIVFEREPIFLTDAALEWPEPGMPTLTRAEFGAFSQSLGLSFNDAYRTYSVARQATRTICVTPQEFRTVPLSLRSSLMQLQAHLGRGQIYTLEFAARALESFPDALGVLEVDAFETDGGPHFALRYDAWWAIPEPARHAWLEHFVSEGRPTCLSADLSSTELSSITASHALIVSELIGSFAATSGPNCFATTLAAATNDLARARSISGEWVLEETFLSGLTERGYRPRAPLEDAPPDSGDVLVWFDADHRARHTCYALRPKMVLNKDGQAWYNPRQLLFLEMVVQDWFDDGFEVWIYSR